MEVFAITQLRAQDIEKVAIVILNYLNYTNTIECVESISVDQYPAKEILIVDNGSSNDSKDRLEEKFKNCTGIHLLFNDKNEGFARGNNLGIRYATDILDCRFVLLVNNDTLFQDPDMITALMQAYEPGVGVLGPRIINADGYDDSPMEYDIIREKSQQDEYYRRRIRKIQYKQTCFYQILRKINIFKRKKSKTRRDVSRDITSLNMKLQGSCLLLTKDYFGYYPYLFPATFLYGEEEILTILTHKAGLAKRFVHSTHIFHKEHQSTDMSFNTGKSKRDEYRLQGLKAAREIYPLDYKVIIDRYFGQDRQE